jgi:hypothetical protein
MHLFEYKMGILVWGERLNAGHRPQNLFSCVFSEQGIFGGVTLIIFLAFILKTLWINRNLDNYTKMFFLGSIVNVGVMFSNNVIYSMYLWVYIIWGMGYVRWLKNKDKVFSE